MKESINTSDAPTAIGTYSQAIKFNNLVFLSGQIPLDPQTSELISGDIEQHIHQVFKNLNAVAKAPGGDLQNIVKLTVYLTDLTHFPIVNDIMAQYFEQPYPARAAVQVAALPKGAQVEMDAILGL